MTIKLEEVQEKASKGEELTPEEQKAVMEFGDDGAPPVEDDKGDDDGAPAGDKKPEDKKPVEPPAKKTDPDKAPDPNTDPAFKAILETELAKPPGSENLKEFTPKEKAYFYEMRTTRRRMQAAESRTKELEFELLQERLAKKKEREAADGEGGKKKEAAEPSVDDFFKGKEEDDVVTVAEIKKVLAQAKPKAGENGKAALPVEAKNLIRDLTFQIGLLGLKSEGISDAEEVLRYTDELLDPDVENSDYAKAAVDTVTEAGRNGTPGSYVKVIYNLIKGHPRWGEIEAKLSAKKAASTGKTPEKNPTEEEKRRRAERLEENLDKARGNGGAGGGGDTPDGELTDEELAQISVADWGKLKSDVREKYLKRL